MTQIRNWLGLYNVLPRLQKKPVDFDDELKTGDVRYDDMTVNKNESSTLLTFTIWNITMLKNEPFMSYPRFKKGALKKIRFFTIKQFLHTFCQKRTICYPTTFFESLITHKRFIFFLESYISYFKKLVILVIFIVSDVSDFSDISGSTFVESLITHKRFVFEESYISNGKRQKSCTLIVV